MFLKCQWLWYKKLWYEYLTPVMIKKAYTYKFSLRSFSWVMEKKMHNDHNNVINWQAHNYICLVIYVHVGLTSPAGKCLASHYCLLGSTEQNPIGQSYGDYCTAGHYCPEGTGSPVPCPIGTYLPSTGQSMLAHCIDCALGKYCDTVGQANYTGKDYPIICRLFLSGCTMQVCMQNLWKI